MKPNNFANSLILGAVLAITGCETLQTQEAPVAMGVQAAGSICRSNCRLDIELPQNAQRPPRASEETFFIAGGQTLIFIVTGGPPGQEATELRFEEPNTPFLDENDSPLYTVKLKRGRNSVRTRPSQDGYCLESQDPMKQGGCKYDIVNTGNSQRPPRDPWIVLGR